MKCHLLSLISMLTCSLSLLGSSSTAPQENQLEKVRKEFEIYKKYFESRKKTQSELRELCEGEDKVTITSDHEDHQPGNKGINKLYKNALSEQMFIGGFVQHNVAYGLRIVLEHARYHRLRANLAQAELTALKEQLAQAQSKSKKRKHITTLATTK